MKKKALQKALDILKEEYNSCPDYAIGCCQCAINRTIQDLESLIKLWD